MARIGQSGVGVPKFVEEWMTHCLDCGETLRWGIFQERGDQVDGFVGSASEYLERFVQRLTQES